MKRKQFGLIFLVVGAVTMLVMSAHYYTTSYSGILSGKAIASWGWYRVCFYTHITMGLVAIVIGSIQFVGRMLRRYKQIHRRIGYLYTGAVALSACTGLVVAQYAMGGVVTRVGFSVLAVLWGSTLFIAMRAALKGRILAHRRWMTLNYALTFSAVTQRTILLFAFLPGLEFMPVYQSSSWLSWSINLTIALLIIKSKTSDTPIIPLADTGHGRL